MRAHIHPKRTQQTQLARGKKKKYICGIQVRGNMALSPFLHWLSCRSSICNKLISLGVLQPPWLHTDRALSICCFSSQVRGTLSASRHSAYNCRLSKAFTTGYKMDLQTQSQDKTNTLVFIQCPDDKLNLTLLKRRVRYKTSKNPHPFKSIIPS